jgi:8-hydroxy-5-deazaflavin:NADPH oxidoreductase
MRIAVIGGGRMGTGLGGAFARAGHDVHVGSRDGARAEAKAREIGAAGSGSYAEVAQAADAILLTVPWWAVSETLALLGDVDRKILIDVTNPYKDETYAEQHVWPGSSGAEKIRDQTGAQVVKAWNHVFSRVVSETTFDGAAPTVFIAADDAVSKEAVASLARETGYDPVDAGPLAAARYLEPLAGLMVTMAYGVGLGPQIALKLLRR